MSEKEELERFIDIGIQIGLAKKYSPVRFNQMRTRYGTVEAIKRLVVSPNMQSGFVKMKNLGLTEWSLEAAVVKFDGLFGKEVCEAAKYRLDQLEHFHYWRRYPEFAR